MRRGRWTRDSRVGWRLDGTDLILDFDPLSGGDGCWMLSRDGISGEEAIDHYLADAMEYVEQNVAKRRCGCIGQCVGHPRGSAEWWEATLEMMDDLAAGRPIPERFVVRPPSLAREGAS